MSLATNPKTRFSLFIIESLKFSDEENRLEGKILRDIMRLSGHEVEYIYIRTRRELRVALRRFELSHRRYLHLSCHGNPRTVSLTLDSLSFNDFASDVATHLKGRRLFISACAVVNHNLAKVVIPVADCYSIIGPRDSVRFDDAVLMWAAFYHLMFRDPGVDAMKGGKIRWALRRTLHAFGIEFDYFRRISKSPGFAHVDIDKK